MSRVDLVIPPPVITIGTEELPIQPLGFGALKAIMPLIPDGIAWTNTRLRDFAAFMRESAKGIGIAVQMISAATGRSVAEIEGMPATLNQAADAILAIGDLSGAITAAAEESEPGEAGAGTSTGT